MKPFISCNNPVLVNTRKGPVFVACHKCIQCQLTRKSIDTLSIDLESQYNSKYQDFLTLTYNDNCLPYLDFNYLTSCSSDEGNFLSPISVLNSYSFDYNSKNQMPCVPIRFGNRKKRMFNPKTGKYSLVVDKYYQKSFYSPYYSAFSVKDVILYNERIEKYFNKYPSRSRGIRKVGIVPILWKEDLQRFIDRLRAYFKRTFGEKAKFKYFAVGEYGTNSLRPHWHILLFHNSDSIHEVIKSCDSDNYNKDISSVWLYGSVYSETTDGHISDYLSGYVNCYSHLPEVLSSYPQKKFKSILFGEVRSFSFIASCLKEKRFRELSTISVVSRKGVKTDVSVSSSLVGRLLPRFTGYDTKDFETTYYTLSCAYSVLQATDINIYDNCQLHDFLLFIINNTFVGVSRLSVALRTFQTYCLDVVYPAYCRDNTLNSLYSVLYAETRKCKVYKILDSETKEEISTIKCIAEGKDNILWIGTSEGLIKFDKKNGTSIKYTDEDGLCNNTIHGLLIDDDGNPWVSTNNGISKFDLSKNEFRNLSKAEGLQSNEFNDKSYFKTSDGSFVFGGIKGLNIFDPSDGEELYTDYNPKVTFEEFIVMNEKYKDINNLKFSYSQNDIEIRYFTPQYKNNNLRFYYKLDGITDNWVSTTSNEVVFNKLSPGKYTFRIKAD